MQEAASAGLEPRCRNEGAHADRERLGARVLLGAAEGLRGGAATFGERGALLAKDDDLPPPPENPMSADRVRWEHIQRVYELCDRNVSETARRLNMHRRTLQRILAKRSPK